MSEKQQSAVPAMVTAAQPPAVQSAVTAAELMAAPTKLVVASAGVEPAPGLVGEGEQARPVEQGLRL
ncbi:hypothetical protein [Micromonospora sp. DT15]|uniref:hypothetical protein n=1 Tax=Micromonospora sp. DT15 TaxID=3393445 RepID=UPI003CECAA88